MKYIKEGFGLVITAIVLTGILVGIQMLSNYLHYGQFIF